MLVKKGQGFPRDALFGGEGTVTVWDLLGRAAAPPFTAILGCELEARGSVGRHVQEEFAEIVIGLEGEGVATVDGAERALGPGDGPQELLRLRKVGSRFEREPLGTVRYQPLAFGTADVL